MIPSTAESPWLALRWRNAHHPKNSIVYSTGRTLGGSLVTNIIIRYKNHMGQPDNRNEKYVLYELATPAT